MPKIRVKVGMPEELWRCCNTSIIILHFEKSFLLVCCQPKYDALQRVIVLCSLRVIFPFCPIICVDACWRIVTHACKYYVILGFGRLRTRNPHSTGPTRSGTEPGTLRIGTVACREEGTTPRANTRGGAKI